MYTMTPTSKNNRWSADQNKLNGLNSLENIKVPKHNAYTAQWKSTLASLLMLTSVAGLAQEKGKSSQDTNKAEKTTDVVKDLSNLWYPFTLKIFDTYNLSLTDVKLADLKNFIENDLQNEKKMRQIDAKFLSGDRSATKEFFIKKVENTLGYNFLMEEDADTLSIGEKKYDVYNDYYKPLILKLSGKDGILSKEQLIFALENNFNKEVVGPSLDYIKNTKVATRERMKKVDELFDALGKYYNRRKYISEAADPKAPIKEQDLRDPIKLAHDLYGGKTTYTKLIEDQAWGFNLDDKTIDENIHILEKVQASNNIDGLQVILEKILTNKQAQTFTIKYRLYNLTKNFKKDMASATTKEQKMSYIYELSKRVEYGSDLMDVTIKAIDGSSHTLAQEVKEILLTEYQNTDLYPKKSKELKELQNLISDIDQTGQAFDLEQNNKDGMTQAEMNDNINDAIEQDNTLYEMYSYMTYLQKVKVINQKNESIVEHFSRKDKQWKYIYTNEIVNFDGLAYITPKILNRLVNNINANPTITTVHFNLNLMKQTYSPENYKVILQFMGNFQKDIILDTEWESATDLEWFVIQHNKIWAGHAVTYNASRLTEKEASQLLSLKWSLHIPRCSAFPWNTNEQFKKDLKIWESNAVEGYTLDMWFLTLGKSGYNALAEVFTNQKNLTIRLDKVEELQKEELYWLNKVNNNVSTNNLSYDKISDKEAQNAFDFGRPPQKEGFFTKEQVKGKKAKYDEYNNRSLAGFNEVSEEDMEYATKNYFGTTLQVGTGMLQEYHIKAYNTMQNLTTLQVATTNWDQTTIDLLKKGKVKNLMLNKLKELQENVTKSTVQYFPEIVLPDFDNVWYTQYDDSKKVATNTLANNLFSGRGNITLPNIKQLDMGWATALHKKSNGTVSFEADNEGHDGVMSLKLYDEKGQEVIVTPENAHEHKALLVGFCKEVSKSWATVKFNSWLQRIYDNYKTMKKN